MSKRQAWGRSPPRKVTRILSYLYFIFLMHIKKSEYDKKNKNISFLSHVLVGMFSSSLLKWWIVALLNFVHVPSLQLSTLSSFEFVSCRLPLDLETLWVASAWSKSRLLLGTIWYNRVCYDLILNETWHLELLFSKTQKFNKSSSMIMTCPTRAIYRIII